MTATIALFGAFSIIFTIFSNLVFKLGFIPPVSYLLFDLGEIPPILCFLIIGPRAGVAVAVIEWLSLNLFPTTAPLIGPLFKLLSVIPTIVGLWIGWKLLPRPNSTLKSRLAVGSVAAAVLRAIVMTVPNALYLIFGFGLNPSQSIFYYILELTAVFNFLQIPFDVVPSYIIIQLPQVKRLLRNNRMTWFETT
ncbi:MAG: hypothetical protein JRN20_19205 [Nitrososphaerota archaeon]|nr:hypothetical protein [Nitrososphaerota archaeon]